MAAGQALLTMIRANSPTDMIVELETSSDGGSTWVWRNAFVGTTIFDGACSINGTGDELLFDPSAGNVEITVPPGTSAIEVRGIKIRRSTTPQGEFFPETTFTPISVAEGSTLRFTEIKLTLT